MLLKYFNVVFIFICLLYGFIPFESSGGSQVANNIHFFFLYALILYTLFITHFNINKYSITIVMILIFAIGVTSLISYGEGLILFTTRIIFSIIVASAIYTNDNFKFNFIKALQWLILFSIGMFFLQFIVYIVTGNIVYLHEIVFPFSEARIAKESLFSNLIRMGGVYIEPGTYSNYMFVLLSIHMALTKKMNHLLLFISSFSIILSFSVWGMIFGFYLLIITILSKIKEMNFNKKIFIIFISIFLGYVFIYNIINTPAVEYATYKLEADKGSTGHKKDAYRKFAMVYENFLIIGQGFAPKFKKGLVGVQDAGLILNLSIVFGIIFTFVLILSYLILFLNISNYYIVLSTLPIFMSKIYYWEPGFWLLLMIIIYANLYYKNNYREKI